MKIQNGAVRPLAVLLAISCGAQNKRPGEALRFPERTIAIMNGDYPDPSIVRDGDGFYMTHSSFDYVTGLLIWHSRDLRHWTLILFDLLQDNRARPFAIQTPAAEPTRNPATDALSYWEQRLANDERAAVTKVAVARNKALRINLQAWNRSCALSSRERR